MRAATIPLLLFTFLFSGAALIAQDTDTVKVDLSKLEKPNKLRFTIAPYAWLAGMSTDVGGEKIRQSFNDLSSVTNLGLQAAVIVRYNRWSLQTNFTYANLAADQEIGPITAELDIVQIIWENKLGYLLIDRIDDADDIIRGWSMETTAGLIYWSNDIEVALEYPIDLPILPARLDEFQNWTDLVIGANFRIYLSKRVLLALSGNVGGFGIGNSSKLYYDLFYANTFRISKLLAVTAGYKSFTYDREDGSGDDQVSTKVKTYGPLIGLSFHF